MASSGSSLDSSAAIPGAGDGERTPLPVFLFTDIENSTPLWDRHRESMLAALRRHDAILKIQIERHGGRILGSRGDGLLAVFESGRPLESVLAIQQALGSTKWGEIPEVRVRLGLHGVPADWEGYDYFREGEEFYGPALNYGARIMNAAWGGQILVSENVKQSFHLPEKASWRDFGIHDLKGCDEPVHLYGLLHPDLPHQNFPPPRTETTGQSQASLEPEGEFVISALPPFMEEIEEEGHPGSIFVARERELATLATALDSTRDGRGQIRFMIGGPGRGKSTLAIEFTRQAQESDEALIVISGNCNAHTGSGDPYLPFRDALVMLTGDVESLWESGRISAQHARRLWELMPVTLPALVEEAPELIGTFVPAKRLRTRAATFASPKAGWFNELKAIVAAKQRANLQQRRVHSQYAFLLKMIAMERPIVLLLEDLHWVDTASTDLLFQLSREIADCSIMIVGTYRPEEIASSSGEARHPMTGLVSEFKRQHGDIWLDLGDLARPEGRHFVDAYLESEPNRLGKSFHEALYRHTGGHPLFTAELLRDMQDRGELRRDKEGYWIEAAAIEWQSLPAKVEGVIDRRIGRLDEESKSILTVASVEGESFTAEVVAQVQNLDERDLVRRLSQDLDKQHRLVNAQALERIGARRLSRYRFRHHLFQHYLYHGLDEMEQTYLHEDVGNALESLYGDERGQFAVDLARHFEKAGVLKKAIDYLYEAGQRAVKLSANNEAIDLFRRGLTLLNSFPTGQERMQEELRLQTALGNPIMAIKGYGDLEVVATFNRAWELCEHVGDTSMRFPVLRGMIFLHYVRGDLRRARELADQLLVLARQINEPGVMVETHRTVGASMFYCGEFGASREQFESGIALYVPEEHHENAVIYGQDPGLMIYSYAGWYEWILGYPDKGLKQSQEALKLARQYPHPQSVTLAALFACVTHQFRNEASAVEILATEVVDISTRHGFSLWLPGGRIFLGWATVKRGNVDQGIDLMQRGLAGWASTGAKFYISFYQFLMGEAYLKADEIDKSLQVVNEGLALAEEIVERWWLAELHRLKGELILLEKFDFEAEAEFITALSIARQLGAKSQELRASMSLARLWQAHGKTEDAHLLLAELYEWFTEGFETADLRKAKILLESLASER